MAYIDVESNTALKIPESCNILGKGQILVTITNDNQETETTHRITALQQKSWLVRQLQAHRAKLKTGITMAASAGFGALFYWLLGLAGMTRNEHQQQCNTTLKHLFSF